VKVCVLAYRAVVWWIESDVSKEVWRWN